MDDLQITDLKMEPCLNSRFIAPRRVTFKQNGFSRHWDYIEAHDSVAILIYNSTKKAFVLVKQFRPALYMNFNAKENNVNTTVIEAETSIDVKITTPFVKGVSYELCAGIVDKQIDLVEVAQCEILEETGYKVPVEEIQKLFTHNSVGQCGNKGTVYFAEVTDEMQVNQGGGNQHEGEFIDLFYLPVEKAKEFVFSDEISKPSSLIAAFSWYFMNRSSNT